MRWLQVFCMLFMSISFSESAKALCWEKGSMTISGYGAKTIWICNNNNVMPCWFSRPDSFCELPDDSYYRIKNDNGIMEIELKGRTAELIYDITKNCYDMEPEDKQQLRYYYGNKGMRCKKRNLRTRCSVAVDQVFPHSPKSAGPSKSPKQRRLDVSLDI